MLLVEDVMTADVVTALEHETVMDMLATMRRKGLRRLPVTTPEGLLLGLMTLDDLIEVVAEQLRTAVMAIGAEQLRERRVRP
jgi:CBS domain-containing protein